MARPASDLAARIVTAATGRFLHDGVDGASLRRIARDARTNLGMVYYYFPTKDDLFLAVVERHYAPLAASLTEAVSADAPFDARVQAFFARFGAMSDDEFTVLRLVLREAMVSSERLSRVAGRMMQGHLPPLFALVGEGFGAGHVDGQLHPAAALVTLAALAVGPQIILRRIAASGLPIPGPLPTPDAFATMLAGVALHGIAPRTPPR